MKNPWLWIAAIVGGMFLLRKTAGAEEQPVFGGNTTQVAITWEPGAGTEWYDEGGTARDYALAAIGFPYTSIGRNGYIETFEVAGPANALVGVAGVIQTMDGVRSVEILGV